MLLSSEIIELYKSVVWRQLMVYTVVDEAHVAVQWGDSFRPDYAQLYKLKVLNVGSRMLALTATASKNMQEQIAKALLMNEVKVVRTGVNRANIFLSVKRKEPSTGRKYSAEDSFLNVFLPLLDELRSAGGSFPKTVFYSKLLWCGIAYEQSVVAELSEHVAMYHAMCTNEVMITAINYRPTALDTCIHYIK